MYCKTEICHCQRVRLVRTHRDSSNLLLFLIWNINPSRIRLVTILKHLKGQGDGWCAWGLIIGILASTSNLLLLFPWNNSPSVNFYSREKNPFLFPVVGSWPGFVDSVPLCKQSISERKHITSTDSLPGFVSTDTVRIVHLSILVLSKWQTELFICRCTPVQLTSQQFVFLFSAGFHQFPVQLTLVFRTKLLSDPVPLSALSGKHQYSWLLARHLALK